jgi:hypothetical protein
MGILRVYFRPCDAMAEPWHLLFFYSVFADVARPKPRQKECFLRKRAGA